VAVERLLLRVADITTGLVRGPGGPPLSIDEPTRLFLVDAGPPDVTVDVTWADLSREAGGEPVFDSGSVWQLHRQGGRLVFRFRSAIFGDVPYKTASFDTRLTRGEVRLHQAYFEDRDPVYPLEYPLDELLMIGMLGQGRGVEIHGCGLVDRSGRGFLFVGQSGAGKTTMARLWQREEGVTILSDERVVLRNLDNRIWMYGTPWHGDEPIASPVRVRLSQIFFLRQAAGHALEAVTGAAAAARLFATSFPPFYDRAALDFTLGLLEGVVGAVPCHALSFAPDPTVVEFIRREAR